MAIKEIIIHCADTPDGKDFTIKDIDAWHKERGFKRLRTRKDAFNPTILYCGYQYVIRRDGVVETGRAENEVGAHAEGHNSTSIGICLIGKSRFTPAQWESLKSLIADIQTRHPNAKVIGHYSVATNGKTCPNFAVDAYVANSYEPNNVNVWGVA